MKKKINTPRTLSVKWQTACCDEVKVMRTKIQYAKDESYSIYMAKSRIREKPISFAFLMPEFTDPKEDIKIGFATNGTVNPSIRIDWPLDKSGDTVGFSMDAQIAREDGISFDLFTCFMNHNQIVLNFWAKDGNYYSRKLPLGNFKEAYLRLLA